MEDDEMASLAVDERLRALGSANDEASEGDDTEEVEHEGQTYRIPSALKGAFLASADHARKSQELEAARAQLDQRAQGLQGQMSDRARLHLLDDQVEMFEGADWEAIAEESPERAQVLWRQFLETRAARDSFADALSHQEEQGRLQAERERAAQLEETGRVLSREIEGWSPEVAAKLVEYGKAFGVTLEELRQVADPRIWKVLHRAHQGEELLKQREAARQAERTQAVRPAVQISGGAFGSGGVRDELGTGDWMKRRNDQVSRAR